MNNGKYIALGGVELSDLALDQITCKVRAVGNKGNSIWYQIADILGKQLAGELELTNNDIKELNLASGYTDNIEVGINNNPILSSKPEGLNTGKDEGGGIRHEIMIEIEVR